MRRLTRGTYRTRLAETVADRDAVLSLRALCFRGDAQASDEDAFDSVCAHVMVEDTRSGALLATFRLMPLSDGGEISRSYAAQFYELAPLEGYASPMVEMGRFCIDPKLKDPDVLRVAWGALASYVDDHGVQMLFGCSSFKGTEAEDYLDAFAMLKERHLAPKRWLPKVKAPNVFRIGQRLRRKPDRKQALLKMPPLLKTYLVMGGWVSDHAVVDRDLDTLHVFTGLEIAAIPPARAKALRAVAG